MSATVASEAPEAIVIGAEIVAGHDGAAELLVQVRHENGVVSAVAFDAEAGFELIQGCGAQGADDLVGRAWRAIVKGL